MVRAATSKSIVKSLSVYKLLIAPLKNLRLDDSLLVLAGISALDLLFFFDFLILLGFFNFGFPLSQTLMNTNYYLSS